MSDTTSPNPYLFPDPELDGVDLYLKVTDQLGDECYDTVRVRFSSAAYLIITRSAYIDIGAICHESRTRIIRKKFGQNKLIS